MNSTLTHIWVPTFRPAVARPDQRGGQFFFVNVLWLPGQFPTYINPTPMRGYTCTQPTIPEFEPMVPTVPDYDFGGGEE